MSHKGRMRLLAFMVWSTIGLGITLGISLAIGILYLLLMLLKAGGLV